MKTIYYNHFLSIASALITGMVIAQPANTSTIPFKEIQRKQFTDNFTARKIKKKELEIASFHIALLNMDGNRSIKAAKNGQKKKAASN